MPYFVLFVKPREANGGAAFSHTQPQKTPTLLREDQTNLKKRSNHSTKSVIDNLIRRGIAPDRLDRTIKDVEVAADVMTNKAKSRIAHRKRAKLKVVKS